MLELSKIVMSQEPDSENPSVEKLLMDKPSDFIFHAAYLAYSEAWDKAPADVKAQLNQVITSLSKGEIDTEGFYRQISQHRGEAGPDRYSFGGRMRIETTRKKDWRKKEAKSARESRHKR
jgi:hypothetical protein